MRRRCVSVTVVDDNVDVLEHVRIFLNIVKADELNIIWSAAECLNNAEI